MSVDLLRSSILPKDFVCYITCFKDDMAFITSSYLSDIALSAQRLLDRVEGLLAIVISDRDGVTVIKVVHPSIGDSSSTS